MKTYKEEPTSCAKCGRKNPTDIVVEYDSPISFRKCDEHGFPIDDNVYEVDPFIGGRHTVRETPGGAPMSWDGWQCPSCNHVHVRACAICDAPVECGVFCEPCYDHGYCTTCLADTSHDMRSTTCLKCLPGVIANANG